jgi:hypothetical protein
MSLNEKWIKRNLPEGDLQLLTTCNASGVLRLTQSDYGIDQTVYFRNSVFGHLNWYTVDQKEMASAIFNLETNGQNHGNFTLDLSHKPSWESDQNNYTTGLHWGHATNHIRDPSLKGKTLVLYQATGESYDYAIKID